MRAAIPGLLFVLACGGSGSPDDPSPDGPIVDPENWQPLLTKGWELAPGGEKTSDLAVDTTDRDLVIGGLRPLAPLGTHHTLLFRGANGTNAIYASGVGTNELMFPPGTAMRIPKGTLIGLQLHIFNQSDSMLAGTSGIEMREVDPATVTEEVDMFLPGPTDLAIQPNTETTQAGTCTVRQPYKVFALFPHMHQLGTHLKTTLTIGGADQVLHDEPYEFEHQEVLAFDPIQMNVGDKIKTECTWNNQSANTIGWGESSTTEMCFSILYRFPRGNDEQCEN